ncbi:MAG: CPBP family intramembrane metalloprotease [Saprospirales bacterium]|jgi:membrane protease YdiL (CAAX protease family)|nr:CPBP family intramembrane metalloprotease [Saprospirales bacterium]MBK8923304.1 CPBP family intramembrane metalloprotease [Saprospirales bacterium]
MEDVRPDNWEEQPGAAPAFIPYSKPEPRVWVVLLGLLGFCLFFSILGGAAFQAIVLLAGWDTGILSGVLAPDAPPAERWQMRLLLGIGHLATFLLGGWATLRFFYPPASHALIYLKAERLPGLRPLLGGILLILVSIPLVLYTYTLNKALPLPDTFRMLEDQTNDAIKGLLQMDNGLELLANLALIALLPALGEELVFRGVVQQQLLRRIAPPWLGLVLAAAIFSFIHFQFEGFLPRMLLGILLGWLYWRTQNFWVPVAAHFANNAFQVAGQYLYSRDLSGIDLEEDIDVPWYAAALSLLLVIALMRWLDKRSVIINI